MREAVSRQPIKVLHLCDKMAVDAAVAGIARSLSLLIPRHSSHIVSRIYTLRGEDSGCRFLAGYGVPVTSLGLGKFNPLALIAVLDVLKKENPDLVHTHGYSSSNLGRLACWLMGIPALLEENFAFHLPWYQRVVDCCLSPLSRHGVAISQAIKGFMVQKRFFNADRVAVVYRGIVLENNPVVYNGHRPIDSIKELYKIPFDHQIVTVVGRLHPAKGQEVLLRAAPLILRRMPKVTFLLAGEGAERQRLEALVDELGLESCVRFLGFVSDVRRLQQGSDVVVVPSISEAFGNAALEAMWAGCAIVASRVEGLAEVVHENRDGLLVEPGDVSALADRITELLGNPALRAGLGAEAKEGAKRFSIEASVKGFEALYEKLVA